MIRIFADLNSGNCLKVKWVAERLGLAHEWIAIDILKAETRSDASLALNPFGQVTVVQLDDRRTLSQSNVIILYFAQGSDLVPADAFERARMVEWMFWEQYSHEPAIAVRRFPKHYLRKSDDTIDTDLLARGRRALGRMEMALMSRDFISGGAALTLADIALLADTRLSHEGGFDLGDFPAVHAWAGRCELELGLPHVHEAAHV